MRWLLAPFRLISRVIRRFLEERLTLVAAALSFDTLLGLVPMIAVGLGFSRFIPLAHNFSAALEKFFIANLLPIRSGPEIANRLGQFATHAQEIPLLGVAALIVTALIQTLTIEHAFNDIWKDTTRRPFLKRLAVHLLVLLLGPIAFGGSLALITFVAGISFGLITELEWMSAAFFRGLPIAFMIVLFALLYWGVPNKHVSRWHALIGGLFSALGFVALQRLFSLYIANFSLYSTLYGAFSAVPIFLVWLFLSWVVVLVGALVVAELPRAAQP